MHIITGQFKGMPLKAPKAIRPSEDRVRKALFDILGDCSGLAFLELFAGSGAVGFEALSQGAEEVVFVERERAHARMIEQTLQSLRQRVSLSEGKVIVLCRDSLEAIADFAREKRAFDLIFLDPPYYRELAEKTLQTLQEYDILLPSGYIVVQHFKKDAVHPAYALAGNKQAITLFKQGKYGDTVLSLYRKETQAL
ncbi:MAG TPA: 16S rRNA (guanine(966)-N(2))-methyltransferase RsmD [Candidatus Omnitrophota bacterium]|nr:16S rRNA (guanine(966)-N(2))-methyltransferase RsmD [Candidatus Omnitrophota bacterium]HRZ15674.1 16S rRNA (guanine(966)-N(2))-methyltransferase RsmD [Candidatus Omnitrophota bacterium]